jgi:hypothetical protein
LSAWLFAGSCLAIYLSVAWYFESKARKRKAIALLLRRKNPSKAEFVSLMANDAGEEVASFLWNELQLYYQPDLTPSPDDNLIEDLLIDPDEPFDWLNAYRRKHGIGWARIPDWPKDQPVTPRNLGRLLSALPR